MYLAKTLSSLISFKTTTENKEENDRLIDWCLLELKTLPIHIERHHFNGHPSITITTKKTKTPEIWLLAHTDVVPAKEELFTAKNKNGKIHGRGAYDMKFAIAVYLKLFRELGSDLTKYDIGIMLTSDEETGGENGVVRLLNDGYSSKVCFDPDGGENMKLENYAKGSLQLLVKAEGIKAHGSRPREGKNAIEKLAKFILELKQYFKQGNTNGGQRRTMNTGVFNGGTAHNIIPDEAETYLDIRFTSLAEKKKIEKHIAKLQKRYTGISTKTISETDGYKSDLKNTYIKNFINCLPSNIQNQSGVISHGTSDAYYFAKLGIPTIITRPNGGDMHGDNEWIDINDLEIFYNSLKKYTLENFKLD